MEQSDVTTIRLTIQLLPVRTLTLHAKNNCTMVAIMPYIKFMPTQHGYGAPVVRN